MPSDNIKQTSLAGCGILAALLCIELAMRGASWITRETVAVRAVSGPNAAPIRILCLGESTTMPWPDRRGHDISWPAQLGQILEHRYPQTSFEIINKGYGATTTGAILANTPDYLDLYKPQIVVAMMGVNDDQWYGIVRFDAGARGVAERMLAHLRIWKLVRYIYYQCGTLLGLRLSLLNHDIPVEISRPPLPPDIQKMLTRCGQLADASASAPGVTLAVCHQAMKAAPSSPKPYEALAVFYLSSNHPEISFSMAQEALKRQTTDPYTFHILGNYYMYHLNNTGNALNMLQRCIGWARQKTSYGTMNDCVSKIARLYLKEGQQSHASEVYSEGMAMNPGWHPKEMTIERPTSSQAISDPQPVTTANYLTLWQMLKRKRIALIAMQYPGLDVKNLRKELHDDPAIIFVDNQSKFARTLAKTPYEALFQDRFAKTWGHCTAEGNLIIAQNVAQALAPLLSSQERKQ